MKLNIDLGELPDEPEELYALADLANIACGGHAGDEASMRAAIAACAAHRTQVIAHPSFVDREGFGRRKLEVAPALLEAQIAEQCARLAALGQVIGVKAHGALYHAADRHPDLAAALVNGARRALPALRWIVGPAGGELARLAGSQLLIEGFADRGRERGADGRWQLVPRDRPGAVLSDPAAAAAQARQLLAEGECGTLCVHGDQPAALQVARAVREVLGARA